MKLPLLESIAQDQSLLAEAAAGTDWEVSYTYKDTDGSTCSGSIIVKDYADADRAKAGAVSKIVKKYPDAKVKSVKEVAQAADSGERVNWTVKYSFDDPSGKGIASGTAQIIAGKSKPELMSSAGVKKLAKNRKNFKITRSSIVKESQIVDEGLLPGQKDWKAQMSAKGAVRFKRDTHGGGTVDRIVAYCKDDKVLGAFSLKGATKK